MNFDKIIDNIRMELVDGRIAFYPFISELYFKVLEVEDNEKFLK
jgi:hypothetical protein